MSTTAHNAHMSEVGTSEGQRQSDVATAKQVHAAAMTKAQTDYDAALKAAHVAHLRRSKASAAKHGLDTAGFAQGLREHGAD